MLFEYDKTSPESILEYAKRLEGKTFQDIWTEFLEDKKEKPADTIPQDTAAKGQMGNLIEECFFGYKPNSSPEPDFPEAGVELKQTCLDKKKDGTYSAGERLSITNISYEDPVEPDFYKSHVWKKARLILLIHYLRDRELQRMQYKILYVNLFTPPEEDRRIIIADYQVIIGKIQAGKAHELSESDTLYLGACTKGATAEKSWRPQFYGEHILAKKRNFCFKQKYMDYVFHTYVKKDAVPYERIITSPTELIEKSFEAIIIDRITEYVGLSDKELCDRFQREYNNNKAQWIDLAYRMLGIKGNHAEEFEKADITVKAIRLEENGTMRESMSFPPFKFMDLVAQDWEDSDVFEYFSSKKFLLVVYKRHGDHYILNGAKLWNMPFEDLDDAVHEGWETVKKTIIDGVRLTVQPNGTISNNLPEKSDNRIIHVRPHSTRAAYRLHSGLVRGNVERDANPLPDGQWMTTQSFWVNNSYILEQLPDELTGK